MYSPEKLSAYNGNREFYIKKLEGSAITCDTDTDLDSCSEFDEIDQIQFFGFKEVSIKEAIRFDVETCKRAKSSLLTAVVEDEEFANEFLYKNQANFFEKTFIKIKAGFANFGGILVTSIKNTLEQFGNWLVVQFSLNHKQDIHNLRRQSEQLREEAILYSNISSIHKKDFEREINILVGAYELSGTLDSEIKQQNHDASAYTYAEVASYCMEQYKKCTKTTDKIERQVTAFNDK